MLLIRILDLIALLSAGLVLLPSSWLYGWMVTYGERRWRSHFRGRGFEVLNVRYKVLASGLSGPSRGLKRPRR